MATPTAAAAATSAAMKQAGSSGRFGKLWSKGHETLNKRRIIAIKNKPTKRSIAAKNQRLGDASSKTNNNRLKKDTSSGPTAYLQGLVTSDLYSVPNSPRPCIEGGDEDYVCSDVLRSTCFLDHRGRVLTDALLWKRQGDNDDEFDYYIDVPESTSDELMHHLKAHKLRRSAVDIREVKEASSHVIYGTRYTGPTPDHPLMEMMTAVDPRHPSLGLRIISFDKQSGDCSPASRSEIFSSILSDSPFPNMPGSYEFLRRLMGIAEGDEVKGKTALETNQEWLNAVSFSKGCYLGQELTARSHFTGAIRKRIIPLFLIDRTTEISWHWKKSENDTFESGESSNFSSFSCIPRLSAPEAGALMALFMGHGITPEGEVDTKAKLEAVQKRRTELDAFTKLSERISNEAVPGSRIFDIETGKTLGEIISAPMPGTTVALAQMRLENILPHTNWSNTNKIRVQSGSDVILDNLRYLPYIPLWWPTDLDAKTGKETIS